jgi:hypothetical protein
MKKIKSSDLTVLKKGVDRHAKPSKLGFYHETEYLEMANADQRTLSYLDAANL